MSLLEEFMDEFVLFEKVRIPDGEGGFIPTYKEGTATFAGQLVLDSSMQARIAEKQGVTSVYDFMTKRNVHLEYHDVFKRKSDGATFRITSDSDTKRTPQSSSLDLAVHTAERWNIPA